MHQVLHDTIIAQCTPQGSGALALIRISGEQAVAIADRVSCLASKESLLELSSHTIHYGSVIDKNSSVIDSVMFLLMRGPKTFTGEDTVEITCHNNPFVVDAIIQQAIMHGARLAQSGEFSQRAFLNGKIDLVQAEAINELIHASTQSALKQALAQLDGSFSQWVDIIEKDLIKALALSEASFEFLDEEHAFSGDIKKIIDIVQQKINFVKNTFNQQNQIRQGVRIAIVGSVNAGKSSLFNTLLNQKRAIVTNIAGTTRDAIEAGLYRNGNYWTLIDTAGLRQTDDIIEKEGIERSFIEAQKADIIIVVIDHSREMNQQEATVYNDLYAAYGPKCITVHNKCDVSSAGSVDHVRGERPSIHAVKLHTRDERGPRAKLAELGDKSIRTVMEINVRTHSTAVLRTYAQGERLQENNPLFISTKTNTNIDLLEAALEQKIADLFKKLESPFLLNKRHYNLLLSLEQKLSIISTMLLGTVEYELLSHHIKDALEHSTELTGKSISEAGMDAVFREFCVGK